MILNDVSLSYLYKTDFLLKYNGIKSSYNIPQIKKLIFQVVISKRKVNFKLLRPVQKYLVLLFFFYISSKIFFNYNVKTILEKTSLNLNLNLRQMKKSLISCILFSIFYENELNIFTSTKFNQILTFNQTNYYVDLFSRDLKNLEDIHYSLFSFLKSNFKIRINFVILNKLLCIQNQNIKFFLQLSIF